MVTMARDVKPKPFECERLHRELWASLAESGSATKNSWPGWAQYNIVCTNRCFACEFTAHGDGGQNCAICPIKWVRKGDLFPHYTDDTCQCQRDPASPFYMWEHTEPDQVVERAFYAAIIALMEWTDTRKEYEK